MTALKIKLPALTPGYNPAKERAKYHANAEVIAQKYRYEKFIGKRRKDGNPNLKILTSVHKQYVSAYVQGMKIVEIAEHFNSNFYTVWKVLRDPLAKEYINEIDEGFKDEFRRMFPLVSGAIRDGLEGTDTETRLKAADRFVKVSRLLDGTGEGDTSEKIEAVFAARTKFVQMIKEAAGGRILEAENEISVKVRK